MSALEHNPDGLDHYVYLLEADGVPFYVGEGRAARAADRVNWARKQRRKGKHLQLHEKVLLLLHDAGYLVTCRYVVENLTSLQSKAIEDHMVEALRNCKFTLANADSIGKATAAEAIAKATQSAIQARRKYRMNPNA